MAITFDYYWGNCDFVWKCPIKKDEHKWIFFGDSEVEMEDAIYKFGSKEEIDCYLEQKDKKYYNDLFELLEEK